MITLALSVPQPTLTQDGQSLTQMVAEKKIDLLCGPVLLPDGSPVPTDVKNKTTPTYLLKRQDATGTLTYWDEGVKQWVFGTPSRLQQLYPMPAKPSQPAGYWAATLIAIGQKDAAGQDKFASSKATGLPVYSVSCSFTTKDSLGNRLAGDSIDSQLVAVLPPGSNTSASVDVEPPPPATAQSISLFLNDPAGGPALTMSLRLQPPYAEVAAAGATISIGLGGDITLTPAPGGRLVVQAAGGLWVNGSKVAVP